MRHYPLFFNDYIPPTKERTPSKEENLKYYSWEKENGTSSSSERTLSLIVSSSHGLQTAPVTFLAASLVTFGSIYAIAIALAGPAIMLTIEAYKKGKAVVQKRMIDPWKRVKAGILAVSDPTSNPFTQIITEVIGGEQAKVISLDQARIDKIIRDARNNVPKMNMEGDFARLSLKGTDAIVLLIELIRDNLKKLIFTGLIHEDKNMSTVLVYLTDRGEAEIFWDNTEMLGNKETVNGKPAIEIPILLQKETKDGKEEVILSAVFLSDSPADYQKARRAYDVAIQLRALEGKNLLDDDVIEEIFPPEKEAILFSTAGGTQAPLRLVKEAHRPARVESLPDATVHPIALPMESGLEGKELIAPVQQRRTDEPPILFSVDGLTDFQRGQVLEAIQGRLISIAIYRSVQDYLSQHANSSTLSLEFDLTLNANGEISSGSQLQKKENYFVHLTLMRLRGKKGKLLFEIKKVSLQKGKAADLHEEAMEYALKNFQQAKYVTPSEKPESADSPRPPRSTNPQNGFSQIEAMATMAAVAFPVAMGTAFGFTTGIIIAGTVMAAGALFIGARAVYTKMKSLNVQSCFDSMKAGLILVGSTILSSSSKKVKHRPSLQWTAAISFLAASTPLLAQAVQEVYQRHGGIFRSGIWGEVFPVLIPVIFAGLLPSPLFYKGKGVDQRQKIHDFLKVEYATRKGDARFLWRVLKASHSDSAIKSKLDELDRKKDHSPEEKEILGERDEIKKLLNEMEEIEQEAIPLLNQSWEEGSEEANWQSWQDIRKRLEEKSDQAKKKIEALREKCKKLRLDERKKERAIRNHPIGTASSVDNLPISEQPVESPKSESPATDTTAGDDPKKEFKEINYKDLEEEMAVMRGDAMTVVVLRKADEKFRTEKVKVLLRDNTDIAVLSRIDRVRKLISDLEKLLETNWENHEREARSRECQKLIQQIEAVKAQLKAFKENLIRLKNSVTEALEEVSDDKPEIVASVIEVLPKPEEAASEKPVLRSATTTSSDPKNPENPTPPVNYKGTHIKFF